MWKGGEWKSETDSAEEVVEIGCLAWDILIGIAFCAELTCTEFMEFMPAMMEVIKPL